MLTFINWLPELIDELSIIISLMSGLIFQVLISISQVSVFVYLLLIFID